MALLAFLRRRLQAATDEVAAAEDEVLEALLLAALLLEMIVLEALADDLELVEVLLGLTLLLVEDFEVVVDLVEVEVLELEVLELEVLEVVVGLLVDGVSVLVDEDIWDEVETKVDDAEAEEVDWDGFEEAEADEESSNDEDDGSTVGRAEAERLEEDDGDTAELAAAKVDEDAGKSDEDRKNVGDAETARLEAVELPPAEEEDEVGSEAELVDATRSTDEEEAICEEVEASTGINVLEGLEDKKATDMVVDDDFKAVEVILEDVLGNLVEMEVGFCMICQEIDVKIQLGDPYL